MALTAGVKFEGLIVVTGTEIASCRVTTDEPIRRNRRICLVVTVRLNLTYKYYVNHLGKRMYRYNV